MKLKTLKRIFILLIIIAISALALKCINIYKHYTSERSNKVDYSWSMMQRPFYSINDSIKFMVSDKDFNLKLWAESLTGKASVNITDINNEIVFEKSFKQTNNNTILPLNPGEYILNIDVENYTGALYIGFNNAYKLYSLTNENYQIVNGNSEKGFTWDYILYTPEKITNKTLLVIPNNTGTVDDNILLHKQNAIGLVKQKSELADKLGVPLLVPVFPRPESNAELYTHSLDRDTILLPKEERLNLQLIAMIDDCKERFANKDIELEDQIIMSGFSASGDFTDRFSFLHPDLVKAASFGGCDNMVPLKTLSGENLPYPIGTYDYKSITGKDFDFNKFADVKRFIYKGSKDEGGWWIIEENGVETTYTGLEYYEQVISKEIAEVSEKSWVPVYVSGELSELERDVILYRVYDKKILLERFNAITTLFADKGLTNHKFRVYENVEHEVTSEIENDEFEFFKSVLADK